MRERSAFTHECHPVFRDSSGFSLVESLLTMVLVLGIAYFVFPLFSKLSSLHKVSTFKEQCQRVVDSKISFYHGLSRTQLIERYNQYRSSSGGGSSVSTHPLCGNPPYGTPGSTQNPSYRAKISSYVEENGIYKYGHPPELGLRECIEMSSYPVLDIQSPEQAGKPYPPNFCLTLNTSPTTHRRSDREVLSQIPGAKAYVRMRWIGPWENTIPWKCPPSLNPLESYFGTSIDIQVSLVSDYLSVGQTSTGGVVDPNRLICSAGTSIALMKESGSRSFRYYASRVGSPPEWKIFKVTPEWKQDRTPIFHALSGAMNATKFDGALLPSGGVVTQFGVDPSGKFGFFLKAFENEVDSVRPLTTYLCALSELEEVGTSISMPHYCRILPRMPGNQIESLMIDWKKGKMWGVSGRYAYPNRSLSTPTHQHIDGAYLLADCSGTSESDRTRSLLYGSPNCISMDSGTVAPFPTVVPIPVGQSTVTDTSFSDSRKLDFTFLNVPLAQIHSPEVTPAPGSPSKINHIDARVLRSLPTFFSISDGLLNTISTSPARDCGLSDKCLSRANARLFFSPDAMTGYVLMHYPHVTSDSSCQHTTPGDSIRISRLELSNPAGGTQTTIPCPEQVLNLKMGEGGVEVLPELISY